MLRRILLPRTSVEEPSQGPYRDSWTTVRIVKRRAILAGRRSITLNSNSVLRRGAFALPYSPIPMSVHRPTERILHEIMKKQRALCEIDAPPLHQTKAFRSSCCLAQRNQASERPNSWTALRHEGFWNQVTLSQGNLDHDRPYHTLKFGLRADRQSVRWDVRRDAPAIAGKRTQKQIRNNCKCLQPLKNLQMHRCLNSCRTHICVHAALADGDKSPLWSH